MKKFPISLKKTTPNEEWSLRMLREACERALRISALLTQSNGILEDVLKVVLEWELSGRQSAESILSFMKRILGDLVDETHEISFDELAAAILKGRLVVRQAAQVVMSIRLLIDSDARSEHYLWTIKRDGPNLIKIEAEILQLAQQVEQVEEGGIFNESEMEMIKKRCLAMLDAARHNTSIATHAAAGAEKVYWQLSKCVHALEEINI